jgi:hypothetical protein
MNSVLRTMACAGLVALSACVSTGRVEQDAAPPAEDHTYYVLGLSPANIRIMLFKGDVANGTFVQNRLVPASFVGTAVDGYVVGATHTGNTLGVTLVQVVDGPDEIFGPGFVPCGGAMMVVFTAEGGNVVYLGDARFERSGRGLAPHFSYDIEAARAYLKSHFPKLADKLQQGRYQLLPATQSCGPQY